MPNFVKIGFLLAHFWSWIAQSLNLVSMLQIYSKLKQSQYGSTWIQTKAKWNLYLSSRISVSIAWGNNFVPKHLCRNWEMDTCPVCQRLKEIGFHFHANVCKSCRYTVHFDHVFISFHQKISCLPGISFFIGWKKPK